MKTIILGIGFVSMLIFAGSANATLSVSATPIGPSDWNPSSPLLGYQSSADGSLLLNTGDDNNCKLSAKFLKAVGYSRPEMVEMLNQYAASGQSYVAYCATKNGEAITLQVQ